MKKFLSLPVVLLVILAIFASHGEVEADRNYWFPFGAAWWLRPISASSGIGVNGTGPGTFKAYMGPDGTIFGTDLKVKGPWADVRTYSSFSSAITSIGATETTLLIPNAQAVSASTTVPSTMELVFLQNGSLAMDTGVRVVINGPLDAGLHQIFSGSGTVSFGVGSIAEIYPQWWGAVGDEVTDNAAAIQAAIDSPTSEATVFLSQGGYSIGSPLSLNARPVLLRGVGRGSKILPDGDFDAIDITGNYHQIINLEVSATGLGTYTSNLIHLDDSSQVLKLCIINNVWLFGRNGQRTGIGINIDGSANGQLYHEISNIFLQDLDTLIYFDGTTYANGNNITNITTFNFNTGIDLATGTINSNFFTNLQLWQFYVAGLDFGSSSATANYFTVKFGDLIGGAVEWTPTTARFGSIINTPEGIHLFSMASGNFSTVPIKLERGDAAGSIYIKFKNTSDEVNIGINAGLSGRPFNISRRLYVDEPIVYKPQIAPPSVLAEGTVAYYDSTGFNPGSGKGLYSYDGASWIWLEAQGGSQNLFDKMAYASTTATADSTTTTFTFVPGNNVSLAMSPAAFSLTISASLGTGAGSGDFLADGSIPMTGTLQMDGNDLATANTPGGNAYMGTYNGSAMSSTLQAAVSHDNVSDVSTSDHHVKTVDTDTTYSASDGVALTDTNFTFDGTLDEVNDPATDASFTFGNNSLLFKFDGPTSSGLEIDITGAFSDDGVHIHQHTGNPSTQNLVVIEAEDADILPLLITSANARALSTNANIKAGSFTGDITGDVIGDVNGNASTSSALAANPTNCAAGSYARGIAADGTAEDCTTAGGGGATYWSRVSSSVIPTNNGDSVGNSTTGLVFYADQVISTADSHRFNANNASDPWDSTTLNPGDIYSIGASLIYSPEGTTKAAIAYSGMPSITFSDVTITDALVAPAVCSSNGFAIIQGASGFGCVELTGGAETNTLETTITGIESGEIFYGTGSNAGVFTVHNFALIADSVTDAQVPDDITISAIPFANVTGSATDSQIPDDITISAIPAANITGSIQDAQIVAAIARDSELFGGNFSDLAGSITDAQTPNDITIDGTANVSDASLPASMTANAVAVTTLTIGTSVTGLDDADIPDTHSHAVDAAFLGTIGQTTCAENEIWKTNASNQMVCAADDDSGGSPSLDDVTALTANTTIANGTSTWTLDMTSSTDVAISTDGAITADNFKTVAADGDRYMQAVNTNNTFTTEGYVAYDSTDVELQYYDDTAMRSVVYSGGAFHDGFSDYVTNEHLLPATLAGEGLTDNGTAIDVDANIRAASHQAQWPTPVDADSQVFLFDAQGAGTVTEIKCWATDGSTTIHVYKNSAVSISDATFTCTAGSMQTDSALTNTTISDNDYFYIDIIAANSASKIFVQINYTE